MVKADPNEPRIEQLSLRETITPPADQRGSSQLIPWGNMYICITHEVNLFKNYLDQKDGMEKQLNALSNMGLISTFIGMITDSRSFLSFPRHEYFRRILCNLIGDEMEKGLLPNDEKWMGEIVRNIAYFNAKEYFGI